MVATKQRRLTEVGGEAPTNGAQRIIEYTAPWTAEVTIRGVSDLIFHRWNVEAVAEKANAAKGSKAKKVDDVESYVYRDGSNGLCLPGTYFRGSIINAAKFRQDPRSPRKSAMDLYKAGIVCLTALAPLGKDHWDYEHKCRVQVQRNGITRVRPALKDGWKATFLVLVNLPEYISRDALQDVIANAGKLVVSATSGPPMAALW